VSKCFRGIAQSIHARDHHATLHGVVFDILVESESRVGLAAVFPVDDRRMACRAVAREPRARLRPEASAPVRLRFRFAQATPHTLRPDGLSLAAPRVARKGEAWWGKKDSNLRSHKTADLQSAPFATRDTPPLKPHPPKWRQMRPWMMLKPGTDGGLPVGRFMGESPRQSQPTPAANTWSEGPKLP
jgi:hypothetical protein